MVLALLTVATICLRRRAGFVACCFAFALAGTAGAQADVVIETVTVANPGNAGELSGEGAGGFGPDAIVGAVDYVYDIGKYEVTAGQYTEFLNAVAATDRYELYNELVMWSRADACKIERSGSEGSWTYSVALDQAGRPVVGVSWGDAARFVNWLRNGQPTGAQDLTTTEDGSYYLNGATTNAELLSIGRRLGATWVIPTEDEWYKPAYHLNDGVTANYFDYAVGDDVAPINELIDPDSGNNANFYDGGYTIGPPGYRTEVGEFENSESPYGTLDQNGNVWERNETVIGSDRGVRGGSFIDGVAYLGAATRLSTPQTQEDSHIGFRVAIGPELPVPAVSTWGVGTMALLVLVAGTVALRSRCVVPFPDSAGT